MTIERLAAPKAPPFAVPSWIRPLPAPEGRHRIAGGWARFDAVDLLQRDQGAYSISRTTPEAILATTADSDVATAALDRLTAERPAFAGLAMDSPRIMGILNVTPDSFSDGGCTAGRRVPSPPAARCRSRAAITISAVTDPPGRRTCNPQSGTGVCCRLPV